MDLEVESVLVPGAEGDFQVFSKHAPVMSTVRPGVILVDKGEGNEASKIFVRGGFAEVTASSLVILAEEAVPVEDLSKSDIEQRIQNAREDLEDADDDEEKRKAQAAIDRLTLLLAAAKA